MGRVTIKEVAARAGVSISTVSNAFSGRKPVHPDLVSRVQDAAEALSYQKNIAASQLRSGRVRVIGLMIPSLTDTFFAALVSHIQGLAEAAGYQVLLVTSGDDIAREDAQLRALLGWTPSGVIAVPCSNQLSQTLSREFGKLPVVLVDRIGNDDHPVDSVQLDNYDAGYQAAEHLVTRGHRDILIAASVAALRPIGDRIRGIQDACTAHNALAPRIIDLGADVDLAAAKLQNWLQNNPHPSAVIASTNVTTLAALQAFAQLGMDVPEAVSLLGFDDYAWMSARKVPLSAMRQPIEQIAVAAWTCLEARINGEQGAPQRHVLAADLMARSSVCALHETTA